MSSNDTDKPLATTPRFESNPWGWSTGANAGSILLCREGLGDRVFPNVDFTIIESFRISVYDHQVKDSVPVSFQVMAELDPNTVEFDNWKAGTWRALHVRRWLPREAGDWMRKQPAIVERAKGKKRATFWVKLTQVHERPAA